MTGPIDRVVIVGAGDCGTRAALAIRHAGFSGSVTLVGNEPTAPYDRPPLSKAVLTESESRLTRIATFEELADLEIDLINATASAIDRGAHEVVADGAHVPFDRLLLAVGSRARRPAVAGSDSFMTLRSAADAAQLRERLKPGTRLLVIGGGFVGFEVAASAISRGCTVAVVEFAQRPMSRVVPAQIAAVVRERHTRAGVDVRCGVGVQRLTATRSEAIKAVLTDDTEIVADLVVAGVGAIPNTEIAANAGLGIENGISVDERLQTDDPAIFAGGDCCSFPHPLYDGERVRLEAWRNALEHADIAANNMLGGDAIVESVPWFWSDQYELSIQIAGLHHAAAYDVTRTRGDGSEIRFGIDFAGRIVSASGVAEGSTIARDISVAERLISQRASPSAGLLANPAVDLRELVKMP